MPKNRKQRAQVLMSSAMQLDVTLSPSYLTKLASQEGPTPNARAGSDHGNPPEKNTASSAARQADDEVRPLRPGRSDEKARQIRRGFRRRSRRLVDGPRCSRADRADRPGAVLWQRPILSMTGLHVVSPWRTLRARRTCPARSCGARTCRGAGTWQCGVGVGDVHGSALQDPLHWKNSLTLPPQPESHGDLPNRRGGPDSMQTVQPPI